MFLLYVCAGNYFLNLIISFATPRRFACFLATFVLYCNNLLNLLSCVDTIFGACTFFFAYCAGLRKCISLSIRLFLCVSLRMSSVRMSSFSVNRIFDESVTATPASLQLVSTPRCSGAPSPQRRD